MFIMRLSTIAKIGKKKCLLVGEMNKLCYNTYNAVLLDIKKEQITHTCRNVDET